VAKFNSCRLPCQWWNWQFGSVIPVHVALFAGKHFSELKIAVTFIPEFFTFVQTSYIGLQRMAIKLSKKYES